MKIDQVIFHVQQNAWQKKWTDTDTKSLFPRQNLLTLMPTLFGPKCNTRTKCVVN